MGKDKDDEAIVRTIIVMAHNLKLKVVAEGVETEQQYEFVKHHGCDVVQGFLFGKPVAAEEIIRRLGVSVDDSIQKSR
ncbi:MAG: EAL domain-containing protein [Gammaproteobacteria bacterium]|nr:EAL domain-containing protein [Gammaproteobacteria bacterium]MCK4834724.1 EAL domain-containing protein [Gammaproteobacteria bacterium]